MALIAKLDFYKDKFQHKTLKARRAYLAELVNDPLLPMLNQFYIRKLLYFIDSINNNLLVPSANVQPVKQYKECCICFGEMDEEIAKLRCKHLFHFDCIRKWVSKNATCPCCRKDVYKKRHLDWNQIIVNWNHYFMEAGAFDLFLFNHYFWQVL